MPAASAPTYRRSFQRVLAPVLVTAAALTATVVTAGPASAECSVQRSYKVVTGGYWTDYDALLIPPGPGTVSEAITTTKTRSTTTKVSPQLGISVDLFITELNAQVSGSYEKTATVAQGTTTTVTAPPSRSNQEIRFGTFQEKIEVDTGYYGCPSGPPGFTNFEYAAKRAAGVVKL